VRPSHHGAADRAEQQVCRLALSRLIYIKRARPSLVTIASTRASSSIVRCQPERPRNSSCQTCSP